MTVGVFSLEMSKEQLFLRMLTGEARIDAHRLRGGFLGERDWGKLSQAIGTLSEAKIFIDDTPSIGVLEMRAKCRRACRRARPASGGHRLHPADAGPRPLREPDARARLDFAIAEGPGKELQRSDRRLVAAEPGARVALRSPAAAVGPARIGRSRTGCRRRRVHLPRGHVRRQEPAAEPMRRASRN